MEHIYFTKRQMDILKALSEGYTTRKKLAARLGVRESTIRTHLSMIYQATGIHDITALALAVRDNGWVKSAKRGIRVGAQAD